MTEIKQPSASDPVQILYAEDGGPARLRTICLPMPRAEMSCGTDGWGFAALDMETGKWCRFLLSGLRGPVDVPQSLPLAPGSGEVEGLVDVLIEAAYNDGRRISVGIPVRRNNNAESAVPKLRNALLDAIRPILGGEGEILHGASFGPGSREPGPSVPASGFDPSRLMTAQWLDPQCIGSGCQSLLWHERYQDACRGRREFREAFRRVRRQLRELERARDQHASREDGASRLRPEAASPVASGEAPASIVQAPPHDSTRTEAISGGEAGGSVIPGGERDDPRAEPWPDEPWESLNYYRKHDVWRWYQNRDPQRRSIEGEPAERAARQKDRA